MTEDYMRRGLGDWKLKRRGNWGVKNKRRGVDVDDSALRNSVAQ